MAGKLGDSEQQRVIDRIMCVAFRIARDEGANFINRKWIAKKLGHHLTGSQITGAKVPKNASLNLEKDGPNSCSKKAKTSSSNRATSEGIAIDKSSRKFCNVVASMFAMKQCVNIVNVKT